MPILLPPSEGKTAPTSGQKLDLSALGFAESLTEPRRQVMTELAQVSASSQAAQLLGLGPRSAADAALNTVLETASCAPASRLFTGVLYEAAGLSELEQDDPTALAAHREVLILSGLWGVLRPGDLIPDHRAAMGVRLPQTGSLAAFWRKYLTPLLNQHCADAVVVDCRSVGYAAAWQPAAEVCELLQVQVVREQAGQRKVVSHHAKHTRGLLTGVLLRALGRGEASLASAEAVAAVAASLAEVRGAELGEADRRGRRQLTLVLA
ncbi:YaaA family protein [Actinomyces trachealis]|uniref:YaaA family protein n=1 Tax=Actinomyces trachealis TaxID=2763540 RepID=UPI0018929C3D|nr:peroxide stress protein YaaA [Actinomyces trachealis]